MKLVVVHCALVSTAIGAGGAFAQAAAEAETVQKSFGASMSLGYTDNVYATENDKEGDLVTTWSSWGEISAKTEAYEWSLGAEFDIGRYASEDSDDYEDGVLRAEGRYNIGANSYVFGGLDRAWEHETRSSPDDANGIAPTDYVQDSGFAGISLGFGRAGVRIGANVKDYDFSDGRAGDGRVINNDDRDRTMTELGARLGYELSPDRTLFIQGVYDERDHDADVDDYGHDRDSAGVQLGFGVAGRAGDVTGEAMIGVLSQDYDDPAFDTTTALDFGLDLTWRPSSRTRLTASVERRLGETTLYDSDASASASGYLSTSAGVRASHWVAGDVTVNGWLWFSENDYQNVARTDYVTEAGFGLRYHMTPRVYLGGSYAYEQRASDAAGADYDEHSFLLSVGTQLKPLDDGTGPRARVENGGAYAGFNLGHGTLVTAVDGERSNTGSLTADFGDDGASGGVLAGYRADVGDMVVGAEIGIEDSGAGWTHDGGRDFSVSRSDAITADLLFGFRARNDALLYTRAGIVGATFDTDYAREDKSADRSDREVGLRGGLGVEIPVRDRWSARMEYLLAAYPDYDLGVGEQEDNFGNFESAARVGLVYSFAERQRPELKKASFDGWYGGVQLGHSVLSTLNAGPRPEGGETRFDLEVPRASGGGVLGAYLGYGRTTGRIYLGGEIDGDLTTSNWNIERDPDGRIISSDRQGGIGASLRAGYVLNDAFLVYARAGVVSGSFKTDYDESRSEISQDDTLSGWRVGLGVEVPLTDDLNVRFDYTHADYEDYQVTYGGSTDRFDPEENLFRVGLTRRF
ncbi:outer membrane beta-barrel protein [uncultured Paracoccus sp.]|uniref:outer membrane beta-barrel protein n=1 Tax=uncultured Paracoccus sp. TaxID=189685 RepID=UPI00261F525B|nr:outer membrane beta-barrel protein [uncultured Paracoccus sp.]